MKIFSIEVVTDLGRRVVQLAAPLDVEPHGLMPAPFRSLTELMWNVLSVDASQVPSPVRGEA